MATHFPNHAFYFEDNKTKIKTALLRKGGFMATGTPGDVLNEEHIEELYGVKSSLFFYDDNGNKNRKRIIPIKTIKEAHE
jgi:iron complex transport system ATP-binding protein